MDDSQNNRINPSDNLFAQSEIDLKEHYDEFGNRIVESAPPKPNVADVIEEDLGITPQNSVEESNTEKTPDQSLPPADPDVGVVPAPVLSGFFSKANNSKKIILAVIIFVVCSGLLFTLFKTRLNPPKSNLSFTPTTQNITRKVSTLVDLPISEQPSDIRNVSDVAKLSGNPFFEKARNGDVVLLYQKNKTAILYRPKSGKVVAIGLLNLSNGQVAGQNTTASVTPSPSASPSTSQSSGEVASPSPALIP